MDYEWDDRKNLSNKRKHGVCFELVEAFDWQTALIAPDGRLDYGENRFVAIGFIRKRLHVCVYTRRKDNVRIISLRKANERERTFYEEEIQAFDD